MWIRGIPLQGGFSRNQTNEVAMSLSKSEGQRNRKILFWVFLAISLLINIYVILSLRADRKEYEKNQAPMIEMQSSGSYLQSRPNVQVT